MNTVTFVDGEGLTRAFMGGVEIARIVHFLSGGPYWFSTGYPKHPECGSPENCSWCAGERGIKTGEDNHARSHWEEFVDANDELKSFLNHWNGKTSIAFDTYPYRFNVNVKV